MKRPISIRTRFLLVSLVAVPAALGLAALFMISVFTENLQRRLEMELESHINTLASTIQLGPDGNLQRPSALLDQRFSDAYGGLYWQIGDGNTPALFRSQSLWDYTLPRPGNVASDGGVHRYEAAGPDATSLLILERQILIKDPAGLKPVRISVASDTAPLAEAGRVFAFDILPYLAGLALFLIAASIVQVTFGLKPLATLTTGLDRIRERRGGRLEGILPTEFVPVEAAINRLLDAQAQSLTKARARAGDLAHGLKTPLTILSNDAVTLREKGEVDMAQEINHLVHVMQAHVDHELVRSRIVADPAMRQSNARMGTIVEQVVKTLKRTPQGETLKWQVHVDAPGEVPIDPNDLRDLVGNLVENAVKWADRVVTISWSAGRLSVVDDGPGADPSMIGALTLRGLRLDRRTPGTGLGLSIVKEICDVYKLGILIENGNEKGLRVEISVIDSNQGGREGGV
jgi:signal transduction histidine kinase